MTDWTLNDGYIPSTRCEHCQRPTPILVHGLGFDCCAPDANPAETLQAESNAPSEISLRFALRLAILAVALVSIHTAWVASGMPSTAQILTVAMETLNV